MYLNVPKAKAQFLADYFTDSSMCGRVIDEPYNGGVIVKVSGDSGYINDMLIICQHRYTMVPTFNKNIGVVVEMTEK